MKIAKSAVRPMVVRVLFFNLLACLLVDSGAYWLLQTVSNRVGVLAKLDPPVAEAQALTHWIQSLGPLFWPYFLPATVVVFLFIALLMVLALRRLVTAPVPARPVKKAADMPDGNKAELARQALEANQRLYLHLITVLQKEGRLLDFFSEDLGQYDDGQIGAAVRNIHESCKKALRNHVAPQAVLQHNEGDEITVAKDFDPNTIKLIGNVTGQPPFKGVVQHRGWRAGKLDLPTFPGRQTPEIIAPAEVEVK